MQARRKTEHCGLQVQPTKLVLRFKHWGSILKVVRLATRKSPLALWQANHVADLIKAAFPEMKVETFASIYTESEFLSKLQDLTGGSVTSNVSPSELRPIPVPIPAGRHRVESVFARQGRADVRRGRTVLHFGLGGSGGTPTFLLLAYAIRKVPGGGLGHCQYEAQLSTLFLGPILFLF